MPNYKQKAALLLAEADIKINGSRPWDMIVHDERLYKRVFAEGSLGLGEAYMDGWWDTPKLDEFFTHLLSAQLDQKVRSFTFFLPWLAAKFFNLQSPARAFQVAQKHYDIGNDLYQKMLDSSLTYTCADWENVSNLEEAQQAKLATICQKLDLKPGLTILDIGCGWGGLAKYAAENYGVKVVGITVSKEQLALAKERCAGLPIELRLEDYRKTQGSFDRIVSIEMFEAVGYKNFRTYMQVVSRLLKDDGLFLLHTIGGNASVIQTDDWIDRYIFPNGMLPSIKQIGEATENLLVMEDWRNNGADYDKTLMAWHENFIKAWPELSQKYSPRFKRMWEYYLLCCAGSFRARKNQLWQIVFSKKGLPGGYKAVH